MNKTYTINIAGSGFVIDEDAYELLHSYLATLNQICATSDQKETAADIERRIAEVLLEEFEVTGPQILSMGKIAEIIDRMGAPEEIMDVRVEEPGDHSSDPSSVPPPFPFEGFPVKKRLFRDTSHKVLGGVCYGMGWYFGIDPVWIRIIMVILTIVTGAVMIPIYIILWIAIPAAKTPYEKMQMMGINGSISNVGKTVTASSPSSWSR